MCDSVSSAGPPIPLPFGRSLAQTFTPVQPSPLKALRDALARIPGTEPGKPSNPMVGRQLDITA